MRRSVLPGAVLSLMSAFAQAEERKDLSYVDMHAVFIVDWSGSMDELEKTLVLKGFSESLLCDESRKNFDSGLHYALSLIFYADKTTHVATHIVHNSREARDFVHRNLWDLEENKPRLPREAIGSGTNTHFALEKAARLFGEEQGFRSLAKTIIIGGDDDSIALAGAGANTIFLAQAYGATVYGLPVTISEQSPQNMRFFERYLATPPGLEHKDESGMKRPVKAGFARPASAPSDVNAVVGEALRLNLY